MIIAKKLRETNIAEYLLYMWQVEDILRASKLDIDKIEDKIISQYEQEESTINETREWYVGLIDMMRREEKIDSGHLIINQNTINDLHSLHIRLINASQETEYNAIYYKTLPFIVELRAMNENKKESEIETCFNAIYGLLLMRLQNREISGETQAAIAQITTLLRHLAMKYKEDNEKGLEL